MIRLRELIHDENVSLQSINIRLMRGMSKCRPTHVWHVWHKLSERNIVIEKSKHLRLIGVFVQQNYSQTNASRVQASGSHSFIHSYSCNYEKRKKNTA